MIIPSERLSDRASDRATERANIFKIKLLFEIMLKGITTEHRVAHLRLPSNTGTQTLESLIGLSAVRLLNLSIARAHNRSMQGGRIVTRHGTDPCQGVRIDPTRHGSVVENIKSEPPEPPNILTRAALANFVVPARISSRSCKGAGPGQVSTLSKNLPATAKAQSQLR